MYVMERPLHRITKSILHVNGEEYRRQCTELACVSFFLTKLLTPALMKEI